VDCGESNGIKGDATGIRNELNPWRTSLIKVGLWDTEIILRTTSSLIIFSPAAAAAAAAVLPWCRSVPGLGTSRSSRQGTRRWTVRVPGFNASPFQPVRRAPACRWVIRLARLAHNCCLLKWKSCMYGQDSVLLRTYSRLQQNLPSLSNIHPTGCNVVMHGIHGHIDSEFILSFHLAL